VSLLKQTFAHEIITPSVVLEVIKPSLSRRLIGASKCLNYPLGVFKPSCQSDVTMLAKQCCWF